MFTTKFRPKKLDDIVGNKPIIKSIKAMMPNIPHMLLKGPPGVGKTTIALAIKNELGCDFLEINASDENGIDVVRGKIKSFMSTTGLSGKQKLILLDEADATSDEFQTGLRRMMEKYEQNCHIILTCNFPHKIIEPIKSRCQGATYDLQPIEFAEFKDYILKILQQEQMTITDDAMVKLFEMSNGDMRIIDRLYTISFTTKNVTLSDIIAIQDDTSWKELLKLMKENKYTEACKFSNKSHIVPIFRELIASDISEEKKMKISRHVAEWDFRKHFAETDYIQLYSLISYLIADISDKIEVKKITSNPFSKV